MDMEFKMFDGSVITEHNVSSIKETENGIVLTSDDSVRLVLIHRPDGTFSISTDSIFR